jgi:predicted negative regulator of RcsB-dependent stress response
MTKNKISRKELLKGQDEFMTLSSRAIEFVKEHKSQFDYLVMAILALIVIYIGGYTYVKYMNKKGMEAYDTAYQTALKASTGSTDLVAEKKAKGLFEQVANDYGRYKAGKLAVPEVAHAEYNDKQYDKAIEDYEKYLATATDNDPSKPLARLSISVCYEAKGEYDKAAQSLEKIMEGPDDPIKEQAMLGLARVYRLSSKQDKSNEILKQFKEKFPKSSFIELADSFLRS